MLKLNQHLLQGIMAKQNRKIASLAVCVFVFSTSLHAQQAALVSVDAVVPQQFTQTVPVLGRLVAKRSGVIATRINGVIEEISVELGDQVKAGQKLAQINTQSLDLRQRLAQSQVAESQTRLKTAKAQLALATQEVKRLEGLSNSAAVSKAAYDDASQQQNIAFSRVSEAEASINSSRATLEIAKQNLSYTEITAAFDGTVTSKITEIGNYVQTGQSLFGIISNNDLELEADIPSSLINGLSADGNIRIVLENGSQHDARLRAIIPEENPRTRTRRVRFTTTLGENAGILASEQSATAHIPASASRELISVHKDGVIRRGDKNIVYIVAQGENDTSIAEIREIKTGAAVGDRVEVLSGLEPGNQVVIRGNERLRPGQEIQGLDNE